MRVSISPTNFSIPYMHFYRLIPVMTKYTYFTLFFFFFIIIAVFQHDIFSWLWVCVYCAKMHIMKEKFRIHFYRKWKYLHKLKGTRLDIEICFLIHFYPTMNRIWISLFIEFAPLMVTLVEAISFESMCVYVCARFSLL